MTKEEAKTANKAKGDAVKKLKADLTAKDFKERFVGDYKGHKRKLRAMWNQINTGKTKFYDQVAMNSSLMVALSKHS
jgi:hypothetical protein